MSDTKKYDLSTVKINKDGIVKLNLHSEKVRNNLAKKANGLAKTKITIDELE